MLYQTLPESLERFRRAVDQVLGNAQFHSAKATMTINKPSVKDLFTIAAEQRVQALRANFEIQSISFLNPTYYYVNI